MVFLFFFHLPASGVPPQVSWWKKLLHVDPFGVVLAMGAITCFVLALQYGGITHPWNSGLVISLLVGFGLLVAALVGWEIRQGDYAMMLPRLYKQRSLSITAPYQFFFMGSYIVLLYYLPIYFQSILGVSPHPVWCSQSASGARSSCVHPRRWGCRHEDRARATGHVHRINVCHRCHRSDLHARHQ